MEVRPRRVKRLDEETHLPTDIIRILDPADKLAVYVVGSAKSSSYSTDSCAESEAVVGVITGSGEGVGAAVGVITGSGEGFRSGLIGPGVGTSVPSQPHPVPIKKGTSNRAVHLKQH
jgi:hypothetical protein